jgi:hypothetical protein
MDAAEILRVGLSGLVFLLAVLGYNLVRSAASAPKVAPSALKAVNRYMSLLMVLAILAVVSTIVEAMLRRSTEQIQADLEDCRDSLERLDDHARLDKVTAANLKNVIGGHVSRCQSLLKELDDDDLR